MLPSVSGGGVVVGPKQVDGYASNWLQNFMLDARSESFEIYEIVAAKNCCNLDHSLDDSSHR